MTPRLSPQPKVEEKSGGDSYVASEAAPTREAHRSPSSGWRHSLGRIALGVSLGLATLGAAAPALAQTAAPTVSIEAPAPAVSKAFTKFEFSPVEVELQPIEAGIRHPRAEVTLGGSELTRTQFFGPLKTEVGLEAGLIARGTWQAPHDEKFQPHESNLFGPRFQGAVKLSVPLDRAARQDDAQARLGEESEGPVCNSPWMCIVHGSTRAVAASELGFEVPLNHPSIQPFSHSTVGIERGGQWQVRNHKMGVVLGVGAEILKTPREKTSVGPQLELAFRW